MLRRLVVPLALGLGSPERRSGYWSAPYRNGWEVAAQDWNRGTFLWNLQVIAVCLEGVHEVERSTGSLPSEPFTTTGSSP